MAEQTTMNFDKDSNLVKAPETALTETNMNPPVETEKTADIVSKEVTEHIKTLDKLVKDLARNFVKIGIELHAINKDKCYKALGFKTFEDFIKSQYGFSRASAYNFINVALKYCVRDENDKPTPLLKKEYQKFSSSQLVAMLRLNEDEIVTIDPKTSIKEIKKIEKAHSEESSTSTDSDDSGEDDKGEEPKEKKKGNLRDTIVPVVRINMAKGMTWGEVVTEATKKVCEHYLSAERRSSDGKNYQIEINIIYPDESNI